MRSGQTLLPISDEGRVNFPLPIVNDSCQTKGGLYHGIRLAPGRGSNTEHSGVVNTSQGACDSTMYWGEGGNLKDNSFSKETGFQNVFWIDWVNSVWL